MKFIEKISVLITLILSVYWFFHPQANIEPLLAILAAAVTLFLYVIKIPNIKDTCKNIIYRKKKYYFTVDRDGKYSRSQKELSAKIDEILNKISRKKRYQIYIQNSNFSQLLQDNNNGIRSSLKNELDKKLNITANLVQLLIESWANNLFPNASRKNLTQMINGAFKVASLDKQLDPFKNYLDIWFAKNHEFRTLAHLKMSEYEYLLHHLGVSDIMEIDKGYVTDLPEIILYGEVIPKIYLELETNADKRNFESLDSLFDLKLWLYGVG